MTCLPQLFNYSPPKLKALFSKVGLQQHHVGKAVDVVQRLPQIDVKWTLHDKVVPAGECGTVAIELRRLNKVLPTSTVHITHSPDSSHHQGSIGTHAPRFPKHVEEGWWLVLGEEKEGELLALKRIRFTNQTKTKLTFEAQEEPGSMVVTLFLMCDSYIGLDQQYSFNVSVGEPLSDEEGGDSEYSD